MNGPTGIAALGLSSSAALLLCVLPAAAQQWEIEVHGGAMLTRNPNAGQANLPPPGLPFTTLGGTPSRRESSWYFGDGASLLGEANAALRTTARIEPLDPVLTTAVLQRRNGASFGVRIARSLGRRLGAEFSFDYTPARLKMSRASLAGIEASRASFIAAWNGVFPSANVTSTATIHDDGGGQILVGGAINVKLKTAGKLVPYLTAGAGFVSNMGDASGVTLVGNYRLEVRGVPRLPAPAPLTPFSFSFSETDTVTLRYSTRNSLVGVLGVGFKYYVSQRWGVRVDLRGHLSGNKTRSLLDASPAVATLTPPAALSLRVGEGGPVLQFANNPSTSNRSTLSGPPITGFETFKGTGGQTQINLVGGVFLRF